ncbi:hypothetical protein LVB77_03625 [Lysobacter sp. 5GHs7-4]|uniref:hypothetical protein n=1 Tax=Lysobacter sp. 5GHs7-4 TaxID=2904253 RepID=UPI001E333A95|nr:hypothetical protein [Lysobacter sp. 5GHs7-4]UHQ23812.1 hypothetical protein LVB77_03625 [Lysobacter sp. 5GHs7-4]
MTPSDLREKYAVFNAVGGGIESLLWETAGEFVCNRLIGIENDHLSKVQLNQLLGFKEERAVSDDFFKYYWIDEPDLPYKLLSIPGYDTSYKNYENIKSIEQFFYGLARIFVDGLLHFGNVRQFYRQYCSKARSDIDALVRSQMFNTDVIKQRGPSLPLKAIPKDDRYLISEMACKSYGDAPATAGDLKDALLDAWKDHAERGGGRVAVKTLIAGGMGHTQQQQRMFEFSADDILETSVSSETELSALYSRVAEKFISARDAALENTKLYLSLVNDLDVYVATSMRTRSDFRSMADQCSEIFGDEKVKDLHLRYFDPTLSAADGHQDKGLIECLMVKCAKVLVYCAGEKESYGKDAEAAMALSLGKPVIFLCNEQTRMEFYKEIHPLSRLINFSTGVAVGAIVTSSAKQVSELLDRIFENEMEYELIQPLGRQGYLQLRERMSGSIVRIQTNNSLLSEAFWNYYRSNN